MMKDQEIESTEREMRNDIDERLKLMKFRIENFQAIDRAALVAEEKQRVSRLLFWKAPANKPDDLTADEYFFMLNAQPYVRDYVTQGKMLLGRFSPGFMRTLTDEVPTWCTYHEVIEAHALYEYLKWLDSLSAEGYSVPEYAVAFHLLSIIINKKGIGSNGIDYAQKLNKSANTLYNDYTAVQKDSKLFAKHEPKAREIINSNILK